MLNSYMKIDSNAAHVIVINIRFGLLIIVINSAEFYRLLYYYYFSK